MTTDATFEHIITAAFMAATLAIKAKGPEDLNAFDCGFAWVTIPGNEPFARYCRKRAQATSLKRYGAKHWERGWMWWGPGEFNGQAIGHKQAGANAFCKVLQEHGILASVGSRYD
jgi:hypothetical protein